MLPCPTELPALTNFNTGRPISIYQQQTCVIQDPFTAK